MSAGSNHGNTGGEDNTVIDSQEQNRQQKELNKFLAHRDRQAKTQESKARKAEVEEL